MEVHVKGLSELLAKLRSLPDKVAKNVARSTMREVARDFTNEVRMKAPRGATGELQRAIKRRDSRGGPWYISQKIYVEKIKAKDLAGQKAAIAKGQRLKAGAGPISPGAGMPGMPFTPTSSTGGPSPTRSPRGASPRTSNLFSGAMGTRCAG